MATEKRSRGVFIPRHDTAENWDKAVNFKPSKGELIVYDADAVNTKVRFKFGDGETVCKDLPFATTVDDKHGTNEIFNDYVNNIAYSKAFHIESLEILFTTEGTTYERGGTFYLSSIDGLEVGDVISYQLRKGTYYDAGKIIKILPQSNCIEVEGALSTMGSDHYLPDYDYQSNTEPPTSPHSNFLWVKAKPHIGDHDVMSQYTHAEGTETQALLFGGHSEGYQTKAYGKYAHAQGRNTEAYFGGSATGYMTKAKGHWSTTEGLRSETTGQYAHAGGQDSKANGDASFAFGRDSVAEGDYSASIGYGAKTTGLNQFAVGAFNDPTDAAALFMVGAGGNDGSRRNAFTVFRDGSAMLLKTGPLSNSVVTREFISNILRQPAFGTNTQATGQYTTAMGVNNKAETVGSLVAGVGNTSNRAWQTMLGSFNETKEGAIFQVGNGGADGDRRSSAFTVYAQADVKNEKSGYAEVQYQGTTPTSVVQKQYVDEKLSVIPLVVSVENNVPSHTSKQIYDAVQAKQPVFLYVNGQMLVLNEWSAPTEDQVDFGAEVNFANNTIQQHSIVGNDYLYYKGSYFPITDTSLQNPDLPANAKAVGDRLAELVIDDGSID